MKNIIRVILTSALLLLAQCAHEDTEPTADFGISPQVEDERGFECGDGICHPSENASSCEIDCAYCGDQVCQFNESLSSCPSDCKGDMDPVLDMPTNIDMTVSECGDGVCDPQENLQDCPADCEEEPDMNSIPTGPTPDPTGEVIGYVDELQFRDGRWALRGWACHQGWAPSVEVEIYADGDQHTGRLIKRELANEMQEEAVGRACGVTEGDHRYRIYFTEEELITHAGARIYVHAVSPVGNENRALIHSGDFVLPEDRSGGTISDALPVTLDEVNWLHVDVSSWPVTSQLSVRFEGGVICLDYDKADVWPAVSIPHSSGDGTVDVVGNPWVIMEYNGQWLAATWEWLALGSSCKNMSSVAGDHIKQYAFIPQDWRPSSGQTLYFMVSALARFSDTSNVQERTDIIEVVWP